jgi:hypothetical protein
MKSTLDQYHHPLRWLQNKISCSSVLARLWGLEVHKHFIVVTLWCDKQRQEKWLKTRICYIIEWKCTIIIINWHHHNYKANKKRLRKNETKQILTCFIKFKRMKHFLLHNLIMFSFKVALLLSAFNTLLCRDFLCCWSMFFILY